MKSVLIDEQKLEMMLKIDALKITNDLLTKDVDEFLQLHRDVLPNYQKIFSNQQLRIYQEYDRTPKNYELIESSVYGHEPIKVPVRIR